ncbi:MAG: glycosyltransferase family 2 protein [Syntrophomonadaceae bacterium]
MRTAEVFMISFIIIGRNEGIKLKRCIESILTAVTVNRLTDSEIIYVDSASTDDSIERVKCYNRVRAFKITGKANPAVARNVGAKEAHGDVLFFIDGDMEIRADFIPCVYNENYGLKFNFVSGEIIDYYYDMNGRYLYSELRYKIKKDRNDEVTTGGLFLIKKNLWEKAGGMRSKYRVSEDYDFGLRLAKAEVKLFRKCTVAAVHHTVNYKNRKRMWARILNGDEFYLRGVLYRDHILNKYILRLLFRTDYTLLLLLLSLFFFLLRWNIYVLLPYTALILLRSIPYYKIRTKTSFFIPVYFIFRDVSAIFSFILFFPKPKSIQYIPV